MICPYIQPIWGESIMYKGTVRKLLVFMIFYIGVLPWVERIFSHQLTTTAFILLNCCWFLIVGGILVSTLWTKEVRKREQIFFSVLATLCSAGIPWLFMGKSNGEPILYIALAVLTLAVWILSFKLAYSFDQMKKMINGKTFTAGLVGLSVFSMIFPNPTVKIYGYFLGYILLHSFWTLKWDVPNLKGSLLILGSVLAFTLTFGFMRKAILYSLWWLYRYVIANVLLFFLSPLGLYDMDLPNFDAIGGGTGGGERDSEADSSLERDLNALSGQGKGLSFWEKLWPYLKWLLILVAALLIVYAVYRILSRYSFKRESKGSVKEIRERIVPDESLRESFSKKAGRILKTVRRVILPKTMEGKVRRMYRDVVQKMVQRMMPVSSHTTPLEVMEILPEKNKLFKIYNDVRYGERKITQEEYKEAEAGYESICRDISRGQKT